MGNRQDIEIIELNQKYYDLQKKYENLCSGSSSEKKTSSFEFSEFENEKPIHSVMRPSMKAVHVFTHNAHLGDIVEELSWPAAFAVTVAMMLLGLFTYFVYTTYVGKAHEKLLALSIDGYYSDCNQVAKPLSGTYLMSSDGIWEGLSGFQYSNAIFLFTFNNFKAENSASYRIMIESVTALLLTSGKLTAIQTLPFNLISWLNGAYTYSLDGLNIQRFQFNADSGTIFNRIELYAGIISSLGYCYSNPTGPVLSIEVDSSVITMAYNKKDFMNDSYCVDAIKNMSLPTRGDFEVSIDLKSLTTAMAMNLAFTNISRLQPVGVSSIVSSNSLHRNYEGHTVTSQQYYDIRFPGMKPIFCLHDGPDTNGLVLVCGVRVGYNIGLPFFHQAHTLSANCDIQRNITKSIPLYNEEIENIFDLSMGLLFFEGDITKGFLDLYIKFGGSIGIDVSSINLNNWKARQYHIFSKINDELYGISRALFYENPSPSASTLFPFCTTFCRVFAFRTYDVSNQAISKYYNELANGSCSNSFSLSDSAWFVAMNNPPSDLQENYFECSPSTYSIVFDSLGISTGVIDLIMKTYSMFLVPAVLFMLYWKRHSSATAKLLSANKSSNKLLKSSISEKLFSSIPSSVSFIHNKKNQDIYPMKLGSEDEDQDELGSLPCNKDVEMNIQPI